MLRVVRWTPTANRWADAWTRPAADLAVQRPPMDVIESEDHFMVQVEVPGISPDKLNVEVDGNLLTISGEMGDTVEQNGDRYHTRERRAGGFKRTLKLADTLDAEHIEATYQNGLLTLRLPKAPEVQPKRITVQTA